VGSCTRRGIHINNKVGWVERPVKEKRVAHFISKQDFTLKTKIFFASDIHRSSHLDE